jgi:hypothetical protein
VAVEVVTRPSTGLALISRNDEGAFTEMGKTIREMSFTGKIRSSALHKSEMPIMTSS